MSNISALTVGVITGAQSCEDPMIREALTQMLRDSSRSQILTAVSDMASIICALSTCLGRHTDQTMEEVLQSITCT